MLGEVDFQLGGLYPFEWKVKKQQFRFRFVWLGHYM